MCLWKLSVSILELSMKFLGVSVKETSRSVSMRFLCVGFERFVGNVEKKFKGLQLKQFIAARRRPAAEYRPAEGECLKRTDVKTQNVNKSKRNSRDGSQRASPLSWWCPMLGWPVSSVAKHLKRIFESSPTTTDRWHRTSVKHETTRRTVGKRKANMNC